MLRRYHRFAVVLVMMMLATPMVVSILSADPDSMSFKGEEPAPPPAFPTRIRDWLNLSGRIDAYLRDHFGLRREMIRAWSDVAHLWLRSGNAFVYVGLDGSLFYRG